MALENTAILQEVQEILGEGPKPVHYFWRAEVLANEKIIEPIKVLSIDIVRDYAGSYGDQIFLELSFGAGTFDYFVYPFRENLIITLFREPIGQVTEKLDLEKDIDSQPMRATLEKDNSPVLEGNTLHSQTPGAGDLVNIKNVKFQLVDIALEQIRMQSVGTIFKKTAPGDALKYLMSQISTSIVVDDENKIEGVDMYTPSNSEKQEHIVIPHGTRFTQIPEFLQNDSCGIYNSGLGFFLQKKHWYVYPLYDIKRYEKSRKGLTLINVPKNRLPEIEQTYRVTKNQVIALVTGNVRHQDDTESLQLNYGNGLRFTDATLMMNGFSKTENNRTTVLRAANNNEYVSEQRKTGFNNVQMSTMRITSNPFVELSRLARRRGSHIQCLWENSDPGLILPGMPVKYLYTVDSSTIETFGIVIGAHHFIGTYQVGQTTRRHVTSSALTLFIGREVDWTELNTKEQPK